LKRLALSIIIGIALLYVSFKDFDFRMLESGLSNASYGYVIVSLICIVLSMLLRSIRFSVILSPLEKIKQRNLFPIVCTGYMAIVLFPLRLGELMSPYLLSKKSNLKMSSVMSSVALERILDLFIILLIVLLFPVFNQMPAWYLLIAKAAALGFMFLLILLLLIYFKMDLIIHLSAKLFKGWLGRFISTEKLNSTLYELRSGVLLIKDFKGLSMAVLLSALIWLISGLGIYSIFLFQNLLLPLAGAFLVLIVTMLSVAVPAGPGMLGNFHYGCILALSYYSVSNESAMLFAILNYIFGVGFTVILGLIFYPFMGIEFTELKKFKLTTE